MKLILAILVFSSSTMTLADVGKCGATGRTVSDSDTCPKYDNTDAATCKKADGIAWCGWESASPQTNVTIQSTLMTGLVAELKANIYIRPLNDGSKKWVVETWNECPSYPCNPKDHMTSETVNPTVVGYDSRYTDGCLTLKLNAAMTLTECHGMPEYGSTQQPSPYKLTIARNGQKAASYGLSMQTSIQVIK